MSEEKPAPVLSYATRSADGVPEFVPEAEVLIQENKRPRELIRLFPRRQDALKYYVKSQERRLTIERAGDACLICGKDAGHYVCILQWLATVPVKAWRLDSSGHGLDAPFITAHGMCAECFARENRAAGKIGIVNLIINGCIFTIWGAIILLRVSGAFRARRALDTDRIYWWIVAGALLATAIKAVANHIYRRRLPGVLKQLMPRDVIFQGLRVWFDRRGAIPDVGQ